MIFLTLSTLAFLIEINLVGRLTGTEVLFLFTLPFFLTKLQCRSKEEKWFYIMVGFWFLGAVITDVICMTPVDDLVRGWSKIAMFVVNFTMIRILVGGNKIKCVKLIVLLLAAQALKMALGLDVEDMALSSANLTSDSWKFGYGQFVTACFLLLSVWMVSLKALRVPGKILPYGMALLNLFFNARNLTGITTLAAITSSVVGAEKKKITKKMIAIFFLFVFTAGAGTIKLYEFAASDGYLGRAAQEKYERQSQGNLGIVIGGRTEILASTQAVLDSPIIGHGSWARDIKYVKIMLEELMKSGRVLEGTLYKSDLIPSHSHLMGAWVEHGILGAFFWFWAVGMTLRRIYTALRKPDPYISFYVFIAMSLLWDIAFSPFGLARRLMTPAWIYLMILIANTNETADNQSIETGGNGGKKHEILRRHNLLQSSGVSRKSD